MIVLVNENWELVLINVSRITEMKMSNASMMNQYLKDGENRRAIQIKQSRNTDKTGYKKHRMKNTLKYWETQTPSYILANEKQFLLLIAAPPCFKYMHKGH